MADKKISQLEKLQNIDGTELIPVAKDGENYSITPEQITADVVAELDAKADKTDITKSLQEKLDRTEFTERMQSVTEQLAEKADATSVEEILKLIPTQATESNKLADKDFVNSSIATNTAEFKGTFASLEELQKVTADANDYGFVVSTDLDGNTVYNRYKWTASGWVFEYALNNSSFTALQWAAINSNITAELVAKLSSLPNASDILTGKQAAAKYYPLTDGQDLEHLVETLNEGLGQVEKDLEAGNYKAKALVNSVTLWGQSFNGSANVSGDLKDVSTITFQDQSALSFDIWGNIKLKEKSNIFSVITSNNNYAFNVVNYTGNVGINEKNPLYALHINGSIGVYGAINFLIHGAISFDDYGNVILDENVGYWGAYLNNIDNSIFAVYAKKGNVVIGSGTGDEKLVVGGDIKTSGRLVCTPTITTDISKVPTTSQMCVVNTSTSGTFGIDGEMTAGTELQVFINNTGSDSITITIPDTFKHNGTTSIDIPAGNYGDINVISDGNNLYLRAI